MRNRFNKFTSYRTRKNGFSLVSVVVAASLTSIFLLASAATIVPMFRSIGTSTSDIQLLSAAQSATDLTIGLLNDDNTRATFDCPKIYGASNKVNTNFALTAAMFGLPEGATIEVWVRNLAPMYSASGVPAGSDGSVPRSYSFDPTLSPFNDAELPADLRTNASALKERWGYFQGSGANGWRVIECRVKFGANQKLLLTTLKPIIQAAKIGTTPATYSNLFSDVGVGKGLNSVFIGTGSSTAAIRSAISNDVLTGKISNDPSLKDYEVGGDVSSFGKIVMDKNSTIGGRLQILSDSLVAGADGQASALDPSATVNQYLQVDGSQTGFDFSEGTPAGSNVLNAGEPTGDLAAPNPATRETVLTGGPPPGTQSSVAAAPSAPSNSKFLSSDSSSISAGTQTLSGITGTSNAVSDYVASGISVANNASLNPDSSSGSPTRLFLEGSNSNGSNQPVIDVKGNINSGGDSSMFQIYYGGSGTLNIEGTAGQSINAIIYAPNANVVMRNTSITGLKFTGAITARNIAGSYENGQAKTGILNTRLILDYSVRNAANSPSVALQSLTFNPEDVSNPKKFKVFSVLEPRNPNDPKYSH